MKAEKRYFIADFIRTRACELLGAAGQPEGEGLSRLETEIRQRFPGQLVGRAAWEWAGETAAHAVKEAPKGTR